MTRRVVLIAVLAFVLAWGTLVALALRTPAAVSEPAADHTLSREEIARHNRPEDCWLLIRGKVYDVTNYIASHPASPRTITDHCGQESTWAFETKERGRPHSTRAWELLETYRIGEVRNDTEGSNPE
jgi:cytochrome b involved in lipid metabolism